MGKKDKVGKQRKDKFYHLAKETGYRSRAAFKLIQLNRKYEFLQRSNVVVDLCAAPGGWLQVVAENAPMSNHIIGIDLVPIPPIRNVITLQEDITTEKCRQAIKKELHTAKADCFLNDGAPNVGKSWVHDAYQQAELTLSAMKLATDFLRKGGWFITKVFRSRDYDALMWIFQQLFKEVHATKPQASRNESAEIFVVCQGYLAPDKIDPKFLDPRHVFKEVDTTQRPSIDLIHPEKKKRQREGYPEGDYTLFHTLAATRFFTSEDFMELLAQSSEIVLDNEELKQHPLTTTEIKECLKDIKLLGKRDIKNVFAWRKKVKKDLEKNGSDLFKKSTPEEPVEEEKEPEPEKDEEEMEMEAENAEMDELETLLENQNKEELQNMKRAKKKIQKAQKKQKARIDLKMTIPGDQPTIQDDENMFDIKKIKNRTALKEVEKGDLTYMDADDIFESDDEITTGRREKKHFDKSEKKYVGVEGGGDSEDEESEIEMEEEPQFEDDEDSDAQEEEEEEEEDNKDKSNNPLVVDMGETKRIRKDKQSAWFRKAAFAGLEDDIGDDIDLENITRPEKESKKKKKSSDEDSKSNKADKTKKSNGSDSGIDNEIEDLEFESDSDGSDVDDFSDDDNEDGDSDSDSDYDFNTLQSSKKKNTKKENKVKTVDGIEIVSNKATDPSLQLDEEGLAIGSAMIQSKKRKREILDSGYHRYMFDDDNLPDWFAVDERKHLKRPKVVTKEEIEEHKLKMKSVDAAPIKKVAEAKARKKMKMLKRQEKARKKANALTENIDTSEKEKWKEIKGIYKKAGLLKHKKTPVTYVVAKRGAGKKVRRPAGVKGKFKVVDGRMKKDVVGMKKAEDRKNGKKMKSTKKKGGARVRR